MPDNFILKIMLFLFIFISFSVSHTPPSNDLALEIYNVFKALGLIVVVMLTLFQVPFSGHSWVSELFERLMLGLLTYISILFSIGTFGDRLYNWTTNNPSEAIIITISTALVLFTIFIINTIIGSTLNVNDIAYEETDKASERAVLRASTPDFTRLTERDRKYIAYHEAGHALSYAALGSLPPNIELVINNKGNHNSLGHISGIHSNHCLDNKTYSEWLMLVLLSGKQSEFFVFKENTMGSVSDHQKWMDIAHRYLSNHFDGIYYITPNSHFELESNEKKLNKLQEDQKLILETLFKENEQVLHEIANKLLSVDKLGHLELANFLSNVKLHGNFPKPLGNFKEFSYTWSDENGLFCS